MTYGNIVHAAPALTSLGRARVALRQAVGVEPTGAAWERALAEALTALLPEHRRNLSEFLNPREGESYDVARDVLRLFNEAKRDAVRARGERAEG